MAHPNHVGSIYTFSNSGRSRCSNCSSQKALNKLSRAQIFLTVPLIHHQREGLLAHLNPEGDNGVQEYLKKSLTWRVVKVNLPLCYLLHQIIIRSSRIL